jgi:UDP-N-acetylmuramoyl-tripeptide--D-alanyl-D-alanine ligase
MNLPLDEITKAVNGTLLGQGNVVARGYSIDTRTLNPGDLFYAIKGPNFDGHNFVQQALEKKAAGVVVDADFDGGLESNADAGMIKVCSTTAALQALGQYVRRRWAKPIIGVTGSAGKTTTKAMIGTVLSRKFNVLRTIGSLNNDLGVPLTLLRLEPDHEIAVLEMGMSAKGEIRRLAEIAEPTEGLITNVNPVHLEFFKSVDEIAEAKAELLEGLFEPRTAYLNNDDNRVRAMARKFDGRIVTFGVRTAAAYKAQNIQDLGIEGSTFSVHHGRRDVKFALPMFGTHNISNTLAAITVGASHEVPWDEIQAAVASLKPEKMRGQVTRFREGFAAIDDSYNSNPRALTEMIRFIGKLQGFSRKIIVAGEMLELGMESAELHQACGREAAEAGADFVIGVQGMASEIVNGARVAGVSEEKLKFMPDAAEAGEFLARTARSGDVVLIKGSRGVKLEKAMNALRARFASLES